MKTRTHKKLVGAILAGLTLGALQSQVAQAADQSASKNTDEKQFECHGVNSCKGKGECGGKGASCAGSNSCQGKGFIYTKNKADCDGLSEKLKKKKT